MVPTTVAVTPATAAAPTTMGAIFFFFFSKKKKICFQTKQNLFVFKTKWGTKWF